MINTKKRIFVSLITLSLLFIGICFFVVYYLVTNDTGILQRILLVIVGGFLIIFFMLLGFGLLGLILNIIAHKPIPGLQKIILMATNFLFPISLYIGKLFGINKDVIKRSYIAVNNQLVKNNRIKVNSDEIIILAPHCLQWSECPYKITLDSNNCKRCGKCSICDLHEIADQYGVKLVVVSGGTLARKFVKEYSPKAVVAIACERDLTSGIKDTPLPVLGVLNIRPNGPCFNTCVNLNDVKKALEFFLK